MGGRERLGYSDLDLTLSQTMEAEQPLHPQGRPIEIQPDKKPGQPPDQPQSGGRDWQEFRKLIRNPIPFATVHRRRAARYKKA